MSNKEILDLMIMGKKISIACPPKDKEGLIKAAEILNEQIDSIPDKSNALILTSLDWLLKVNSHKKEAYFQRLRKKNLTILLQKLTNLLVKIIFSYKSTDL